MKAYEYFQELIVAWFQGLKTKQEIIAETKGIWELEKHETESSFFLYAIDMGLHDYNPEYAEWWQMDQEEMTEIAPTIKGLIHQVTAYISGDTTEKDFLEWATFYNVSNGGGQFENTSIEYYCLFFLPNHFQEIDHSIFKSSISIIEKSAEWSYAEFVLALYLLLPQEKKSFYYFLKSYLEGKKTDDDLNQYLVKKLGNTIPKFSINITNFPYRTELLKYKGEKLSVDDFIKLMNKIS